MARPRSQENTLRLVLGRIMRQPVPDDMSIGEALEVVLHHTRVLEEAWLKCHGKHVEQSAHTEPDPAAYAVVTGLCGVGFTFSQVEDYEYAIELALRAFYEGRASMLDGLDPAARMSALYGVAFSDDPEEVIGQTHATHAITGGREESHT